MNNLYKKAFIFILLIIVFQYAIWNIYPHFVPISAMSLQNYKKAHTDVLYFGDSTLHYVNIVDQNKTPLYEKVSEKISPLTLGVMMHDSYQSEIELAYLREMVKQKYFPKYVIIPINLRSFSPEWDLRPGFQFPDEKVYLDYIHTPLEIFLPFFENFQVPEMNASDQRAYLNADVYNGDKIIGKAPQMEDTTHVDKYSDRLKQLTTYFYMYRLHKEHRKVQALIRIAELLKNSKTKVIFYITPIDIDTGNKYVGSDFEKRISENSSLLVSLLQDDATVINLSKTLHTKDFSWKAEGWYTNEHLLESGREFLSSKIADIIKPK